MRHAFTASIYPRNGGKVLLVFHKRFNLWVPVGGELEEGETPLEGAIRELLEETGIEGATFPVLPSAIVGTPSGLLGYEEHSAGSKGWHMNFAFVADVRTRRVILCDEHTDYGWFSAGEARLLPAPPNIPVLVEMALLTP